MALVAAGQLVQEPSAKHGLFQRGQERCVLADFSQVRSVIHWWFGISFKTRLQIPLCCISSLQS